jgi:hypothetical protein
MTALSFSRNGGLLKGKRIVTVTAERDVWWQSLSKAATVWLTVPTVGRKSNRVSQNGTKHCEMADSDFIKYPVTDRKAQSGCRGIAILFPDIDTRMGGLSAPRYPAAFPPEKTRYPLYRKQGGSQDRSGRVRKISSPPGFDPRTVQTVSSPYTD